MKDVISIAVSIPNEGLTKPEAYDNHLVMSHHLGIMQERWKWEKRKPRYEFYWYTAGRMFTPMARERLVNEALKNEMDMILMYDDDMILPIDMVDEMLFDMEKHPEIDVLSPLAFMRNKPHYPVVFVTEDGYDKERHEPYYINKTYKNYPQDTLFECDAVGFGAVLIKMDVVKKMTPHYFFSTTGTGEDIYFCNKAKKEAKARIFVDSRIKLGHIGAPIIIEEETYFQELKARGEERIDAKGKYAQNT